MSRPNDFKAGPKSSPLLHVSLRFGEYLVSLVVTETNVVFA